MKVLIIGFGSIGKRHYEVLNSFKDINLIDIVTKQNISNMQLFKQLSDVDDGNILSIEEKPVHNFFVSGGVYVLDNKVLNFIPDDEFYDMPTLFGKLINDELKSISFPIHEYWLDIGRMDEYEKANREYSEVF